MARASVDVETGADTLGGIADRVTALAGAVVGGWLEDADPYPDGTRVQSVAAAHEFGTSTIPARAPLRRYFDGGGRDELASEAGEIVGDTVDGDAADLEPLGRTIVEGVRGKIEAGLSPALSPVTLANPDRDPRGIPLLDTGHLVDQLDSEVE